jgi:hypothetical protein
VVKARLVGPEDDRPRTPRRRAHRRRRAGGPGRGVAVLLLALLLLLILGGAGAGVYFLLRSPAGPPPRERLVGTWVGISPNGNDAALEYRGDGTLTLTLTRNRSGENRTVTVTGTWKVVRESRNELKIHESVEGVETDTVITFDGPDRYVRKVEGKAPVTFTRR